MSSISVPTMRSISQIFSKVKKDMTNTSVRISNTFKKDNEQRVQQEQKLKERWSECYHLKKENIHFDTVSDAVKPSRTSQPRTIYQTLGVHPKFEVSKQDILDYEENASRLRSHVHLELGNQMKENVDDGIRWMTWSLGLDPEETLGESFTPAVHSWVAPEDQTRMIMHTDYDVGLLLRSAYADYSFLVRKQPKLGQLVTAFEYMYYHVCALAGTLANSSDIQKFKLVSPEDIAELRNYSRAYQVTETMKEVFLSYLQVYDESTKIIHYYAPYTHKLKYEKKLFYYDGKYQPTEAFEDVQYDTMLSISRFFFVLEEYENNPQLFNDFMYELGIEEEIKPEIKTFYSERNKYQDNKHFYFFEEIISIRCIFRILSIEKQYLKSYKSSAILKTIPKRYKIIKQLPFKIKNLYYILREHTTPILLIRTKTNYKTDGLMKIKNEQIQKLIVSSRKHIKNKDIKWNTFYKFELKEKYIKDKRIWFEKKVYLNVEKSQCLERLKKAEQLNKESDDGYYNDEIAKEKLRLVDIQKQISSEDGVKVEADYARPRFSQISSSSEEWYAQKIKRKGKCKFRDKGEGFYAFSLDQASSSESEEM